MTISLASETIAVSKVSQLASRDKLGKADRLELLKAAASCGVQSSIHAKVYDWWAELDREVFGGRLDPCQIVIGVTEYSGCLGLCSMVAGQARITLHQALIDPSYANEKDHRWGFPKHWLGEQLLKDVLLHEMQHQAQSNLGMSLLVPGSKHRTDHHHCESWSDLCNKSARYLGIPTTHFPTYKRGKSAAKDGKRANCWRIHNEESLPTGKRIAAFEEIGGFPHATFRALGMAEARYGNR